MAHTDIYTLFTDAPFNQSRLLYSAENWVRVRFTLETAGPVAVSTRQDIIPVLSGKGVLLTTDEEQDWILPKGDRLFWAAEAINRVKFSVEPVPYGERSIALLGEVRDATKGVISAVLRAAPKKPTPPPKKEFPCPPRLRPPIFPGK